MAINDRVPNPGDPKKVVSAEMAAKCLELRKGGFSYRQIAKAMGWRSVSLAHRVVTRELDKLNQRNSESANQLRALVTARLESDMQRVRIKALPQPSQANPNPDIDPDHYSLFLGIQDRLVKLHGLDAPQKIQVTHTVLDTCGTKLALAIMEFIPDEARPKALNRIRQIIEQSKPRT